MNPWQDPFGDRSSSDRHSGIVDFSICEITYAMFVTVFFFSSSSFVLKEHIHFCENVLVERPKDQSLPSLEILIMVMDRRPDCGYGLDQS